MPEIPNPWDRPFSQTPSVSEDNPSTFYPGIGKFQTGESGRLKLTNFHIDDETGFLICTRGMASEHWFSPVKKKMFLGLIADTPWRIIECCKRTGVDLQTVKKHLIADRKFYEAFCAAKNSHIEKVMQKNADEAMTTKGVADRIFFLKAALPDVYNPTQRVEYTHGPRTRLSGADASQFLDRQSALEAEVLGHRDPTCKSVSTTTALSESPAGALSESPDANAPPTTQPSDVQRTDMSEIQ